MTNISKDWRDLFLVEYGKDTWTLGFIDGLIHNSNFTLVNEIIIYKGFIYLVPGLEVKRMVLRVYHDSPMIRHQGFYKNYQQIHKNFS